MQREAIMARKKDYWQVIAAHVAAVVKDREIEHVLHFTRLENLPGILEHGLQPRSNLTLANLDFRPSDTSRLDEKSDAVSVSISCYYPAMFAAKRFRAGSKPWVILFLNPSLLSNCHCLFLQRGAATTATIQDRSKRFGGYALCNLFDDLPVGIDTKDKSFREYCHLPRSWPTYPDSEVQVVGSIHSSYLTGAWVETIEHEEYVRAAFNAAGRRDCDVGIHPFEPRICCKPYSWG
ncbi:DarT ssDNA thymidine ADP-ribosyltransferase family protein [Sphingomonas lenta]|uniref:DarT domain-containing protein n=1 Tax=Sphingomonas lenta TaxID=1141887 RepID=A0A2A2SI08_9SPHN|nr:DarT ssDNA thymidine ADP-ribosyltransferase family protein [Sphingomonas lenta]PAX08872.1 hypothetical protein CKY28_05830 [Sphingomonas lenta]